MNFRTTIALVLVAAAFVVWLVVVESKREPDTGEDKPAKSYLLDFEKAEATRIEIDMDPDQAPVILTRAEGGWTVTKEGHREYPAVSERVEDYLERLRALEGTDLIDEGDVSLADYGLAEPAGTVSVSGKSGEGVEWAYVLKVGDQTPVGNERYATVGEGRRIYLLQSYQTRALDKDLTDFRERDLIAFPREEVARLEVFHHASKEFTLVREEGKWQLAGDPGQPVDSTRVEQAIDQLDTLWVSYFTFDRVDESAKQYGLDKPTQRYRLLDAEGNEVAAVAFGDRVPAKDEEGQGIAVQAGGRDEVVLVAPVSVEKLPRTPADLAPEPEPSDAMAPGPQTPGDRTAPDTPPAP